MSVFRVRNAVLLAVAGVGLGACSGYYGDGLYGGASVGTGYYDGYGDGYYNDGYGYNSYSQYGDPYWGWSGDYYYPGYGTYVYDQYRRPYRWNDYQQRYWGQRRKNWRGSYRNDGNWDDFDRNGRGNRYNRDDRNRDYRGRDRDRDRDRDRRDYRRGNQGSNRDGPARRPDANVAAAQAQATARAQAAARARSAAGSGRNDEATVNARAAQRRAEVVAARAEAVRQRGENRRSDRRDRRRPN